MKKHKILLAIMVVLLSIASGVDESYAGQATAYATVLIIIPPADAQAAETKLTQQTQQQQTQPQTSEDTTPAEQQSYAQNKD